MEVAEVRAPGPPIEVVLVPPLEVIVEAMMEGAVVEERELGSEVG